MIKDIETKWLLITRNPPIPGRKTHTYRVVSMSKGILLGEVKWHGPWRQFCFFPEDGTLWNSDCLATIQDFLAELKAQRKRTIIPAAVLDGPATVHRSQRTSISA